MFMPFRQILFEGSVAMKTRCIFIAIMGDYGYSEQKGLFLCSDSDNMKKESTPNSLQNMRKLYNPQ